MARVAGVALILLAVVVAATFVPNTEARKLLENNRGGGGDGAISVPSLFQSLLLSALPKGTVPASSPSKKGHSTLDNVERFQRHLAQIDRILRSVPSPGVGH
ncbi:unnamed protein product [Linum tenue]|uniref:Uncharacterized protein n=1 Tax=Linum tenue TaxID=586396 RepID=A0AAV0PY40_9ROSI|nr:unnamed protein product [Linum tenue]